MQERRESKVKEIVHSFNYHSRCNLISKGKKIRVRDVTDIVILVFMHTSCTILLPCIL